MIGYTIKELKEKTLEELIKLVKKGDIAEPTLLEYDLDVAVSDKYVAITGNFFGVLSSTDAAVSVRVRFNKINSPEFTLTQGLYFIRPYDQVFISWDAQASKAVKIISSPLAPELYQIIDNRSEQQQTTYLQTIAEELKGSSSGSYDTQKTVGTTPAVEVLAANTSRKSFVVQAAKANTGLIYIGYDNTVTTTKAIAELQPGQALVFDDYQGTVYAIADTAAQKLFFGEH
jgi:hypothetical protein